MPKTVGLIGCGNIGSRLAHALLGSGRSLTCYDIDPKALEPLVATGAKAASSPRSVAEGSEVVLLSLPGSNEVERVVYGSDGLLGALTPAQVLIDLSSSLPASTRRIASDLRARGVPMLDAPVTNISGGLSLMVGGPIRTFERMKPLLETLGVHATWVGESGAGHVVKLCQNLVTGVYTAVAAEAFVFARQAGIDPERLEAALLTTGAAPAARQFPNFRERRFAGRGQMALHSKDMWYMMQTAREIGAAVPFATMLHELFQLALHHGDADWTQAGLVTFFERAARPATGADGPG